MNKHEFNKHAEHHAIRTGVHMIKSYLTPEQRVAWDEAKERLKQYLSEEAPPETKRMSDHEMSTAIDQDKKREEQLRENIASSRKVVEEHDPSTDAMMISVDELKKQLTPEQLVEWEQGEKEMK